MRRMQRVGFVMDDMIPSFKSVCAGRCGARGYLLGNLSASSCAVMRFGWVADEVNRRSRELGLRYEAYRSWRRGAYDALVFLKSMGPESLAIAEAARPDTRIIFDVNVDYRTPPTGSFFYDGMAPSEQQRACALAMTRASDAVIADSEHIAAQWQSLGREVCCIPDNVDMSQVPDKTAPFRLNDGKLTLFWSGEAVKLFDLLLIEKVLKRFADRIRLVIVTSDLSALDRWYDGYADRLRALLSCVEHEILPFKSIRHLLELYSSRPGVFVSPRFLDNSYNLGHTEWKITLAMACGRCVLCSPQPSYVRVSEHAHGRGIKLCESEDAWEKAFDEILGAGFDADREGEEGRAVVDDVYSTRVVAGTHAAFVQHVLAGSSKHMESEGGGR